MKSCYLDFNEIMQIQLFNKITNNFKINLPIIISSICPMTRSNLVSFMLDLEANLFEFIKWHNVSIHNTTANYSPTHGKASQPPASNSRGFSKIYDRREGN